MRLRGWILVALIVLFWLPSAARAADPNEQYTAALTAYDAGRYEEALTLFRDVEAALHSPNAMLYQARCYRELGRLAEAYRAMSRAMRAAATLAGDDERYAKTRDAAAMERGALDPQVGLLVIVIPSEVEGVRVSLAGEPIAAEELGEPIAVMPGEVTVAATAPQRFAYSRSLAVAAGTTQTVTIKFEPAPGASSEPPPPPAPQPRDDLATSPFGGLRIAGIAVAAVGVAGLVTFGVAAAVADAKYDALFEECAGSTCADDKADDVASGRTLDTVANVALTVGIVASVAGAAMIVFGGPGDDADAAARLEITPVGLRLRGRF